MPQIGDKLLHYTILTHLGQGGMGQVYKALDNRLGREVALKFVLNQEQLKPEQRERLLSEAKAIAQFQHPNIAHIYAIEDYGDEFFLTMAFYDGESLDKTLARGPLPLEVVLQIFEQLLEGMEHAHKKGIIHRDLKPSNILVTSEGVVKVLDFGTARLPGSRLTQQQQWLGSLDYMPPEQFKHKVVDIRSDIWSLGVLLFELLTGELPFKGEFPQIMLSILKDNPKPLTHFFDEPMLQDIIERCLAKDKEGRFKDCQELSRALQLVRISRQTQNINLEQHLHNTNKPLQEQEAINKERQENQDAINSHQLKGSKILASNPETTHLLLAQTEQQYDNPAKENSAKENSARKEQRPTLRNTLQRRKANLIGREKEVHELTDILLEPSTYLVTITGLGGAGKTSLAQSIMLEWQIIDEFVGGQFFIDLSSLHDASRFPYEIAQVLKVQVSQEHPWEGLINYLRAKRVLLVLDNFEHLLHECLDAVEDLLEACQKLTLLITSREVLNLNDEVIYDLQGLSLPPDSKADFQAFGATSLFISSAQRLKRSFEANKNKAAILDICRYLEGWPLGIELAVAWIRQLTPQEIAAKLRENFDFLSTRARANKELSRHRSARAAFDYSWQMLSAEEQDVLAKLAVFDNRFTLQGGNEVAGLDLPLVAALVDKSLLNVRSNQSYSRHPLILEFCSEKLHERADYQEIYEKHAFYFLNLIRDANQHWRSKNQLAWLHRVDRDIENIYKALAWLYDNKRLMAGLELANLASYPCRLKNYYQKGQYWLEQFLELDNSMLSPEQESAYLELRADAHFSLSHYGFRNYNFENDHLKQALEIYRQLEQTLLSQAENEQPASWHDDHKNIQKGIARCLQRLSNNYTLQGKIDESKVLAEQSLALFESLDDKNGAADIRAGIGVLHYTQGEYPEAKQFLHEAYSIYAINGDIEHTARTLHRLGNIALDQAEYEQAKDHYEEAIDLRRQLGDAEYMALSSINIGLINYRQGNYPEAESYFEDALNIFENIGSTVAIPWVKNNLARIYHQRGDSLKAERYFHESLIASRDRDDRQQIAWVLQALAVMKLDNGVLNKAKVNLKESLLIFHEFNERYGIIENIEEIGRLALINDNVNAAIKLLAAMHSARETYLMPLEPNRTDSINAALQEAEIRLGNERFNHLWQEYSKLELEDALDFSFELLESV